MVSTLDAGPTAAGLNRASGGGDRLGLGVSGLYFALYLHYGFFAFMPLWLKETGAPPEEIGVLLAIPLILRLLTVAPFFGLCRTARLGPQRNCLYVAGLGGDRFAVTR
jgi:PPP family 3-phenylpropionic acid transporter